jgi:hypothetical protein
MPRLSAVLALAIAAAVAAPAAPVDAQQRQKSYSGASGAQYKSKPARRPQVIIRDRDRFYGPPLPPSSTERNYYGPAPGIQPPMERVPLPAPLAPPPIRNP